MSQTSFLESLSRWTTEECRQNIDQALPQLLNKVSKSSSCDLVPLKLLSDLFVPVCPIQRLEAEVYSKIHKKIISLTDELYAEICETISNTTGAMEDMQTKLISLVETCMELVGCIDRCVCAVLQSASIEMRFVHSLSPVVLHVLQGSYTHCKDSSQIYGRFLGSLTGQLSALFKKTHALQMNFISLVDKITLSPSDANIKDLCAVLQGFYDVSVVAVSLDVKVMIIMWKTISRLACQHKTHLHNTLDIDPMLLSLATDMMSSFTYMVQMVSNGNQNDGKAFTKSVKVLGFQMKVLVTLVKEYVDSLHAAVPGIVQLILTIKSSLPPSHQSSQLSAQHREDLERQVTVAVEPLVSYLVPHREFVVCLTERKQAETFDQWLPLCMTLLMVAGMLPNHSDDVQTMWLDPEDKSRLDLLQAIFSVLDKCYIELCLPASLPGIMCQGKPQKSVTLYEYICTRLCGFIACVSAKHLKCVERCLLQNVLSHNVHNAMLAADLWCFLVRYAPAPLCRDHCTVLTRLLCHGHWAPSAQSCHLVVTLRRLLKFLAPEHQPAFLSAHPVPSSLPLYTILPVSVFSPEARQRIALQVYSVCVERAEAWCGGGAAEQNARRAREMTQLYRALCNICTAPDTHTYVQTDVQTSLVHRTMDCVLTLTTVTMEKYGRVVQTLAASLVDGLADVQAANHLDNAKLMQLLDRFSTWLKLPSLDPIVKMAVTHFLHSLGKKKFAVDSQQARLLQTLPRLWSTLLADTHPATHQVALEAFAAFAEETVHETIVSDSLQTGEEATQTRVVCYLNKLANGVEPTDYSKDSLLKEYECLQKKLNEKVSYTEMETDTNDTRMDSDSEPMCKRQRTENCAPNEVDPKIQEILSSLRLGADSLSTLLSEYRPIPKSVVEEILHIKAQLNTLTEPT